jgi:hypothetical protein
MGNNATKKDKMRVTQRRREFKQNEEKGKKDEKSRKGKDDTHKPDYPITELWPLFDRVSSSSIESS